MNDWMARISLNRHPLLRGIHDACQAVEVCGASTALTSAVTKVGDLMEPARVLLDERDSLRAEVAQARAERDEARTALDGWVKWASTSRCIYCGQEFTHDPHDQEAADEPKKAHILVCESHPLRQAKAENATLRAELQAAQAVVREWIAAVADYHPLTWAMDPTSPRLMVGNIVRAAREQAHPTPAQEGTKQRTVAGYPCPSSECPFCSGEQCWTHSGDCNCDVLARHEGAPAGRL